MSIINVNTCVYMCSSPLRRYVTPSGECGAGAHIFVIDTGVRPTHVEFQDASTGRFN